MCGCVWVGVCTCASIPTKWLGRHKFIFLNQFGVQCYLDVLSHTVSLPFSMYVLLVARIQEDCCVETVGHGV